jgi:hypothetical protein
MSPVIRGWDSFNNDDCDITKDDLQSLKLRELLWAKIHRSGNHQIASTLTVGTRVPEIHLSSKHKIAVTSYLAKPSVAPASVDLPLTQVWFIQML